MYLKDEDSKGVQVIDMFCDGCAGQNKNSVLPTMILHFLSQSTTTHTVNLNIMVPNHGQSEGDSMHACIERAYKRMPEMYELHTFIPSIHSYHPSELHSVARLAGKNPYVVFIVNIFQKQPSHEKL